MSGNTANGYINFLSTNVKKIDQVIVLKHRSHTLKTKILEKIISDYESTSQLEVICSPFGSSYIEGIIIRDQSLAIVTDSIAGSISNKTVAIDLTKYYPHQMNENSLSVIKTNSSELHEKAYACFSKGLRIHDDLEAVYIKEMNFNKADQLANTCIKELLKNVPIQKRTPTVYHRFFGTNTAEGSVNILPQMTNHLSKRVYVKGRAGTGKSVFMKKVAKACEDYGYDVECYHCSFDPDSIDMVLVPEIDFCMFDSTYPHEYSPEREGDTIIDLYEQTVTQGTDEKHAQKIREISRQYKVYINKGIDFLREAKVYQDRLEEIHEDIDQIAIHHVTKKVLKHIL